MELEKRLRDIAQKGIIKIFNAFRTPQTKGKKGNRAGESEGVSGDC